ncbi:MAG: hypothetical protein KGD63_08270, partial [Candidatus Lokiarchaeota archaeon]|nr:hypothetical protein [Candidatus Lokiarchaeota archaeon]
MKKKNITYSILLVLLILQGICFINIIPINSGNQQISNTQNEFSLRNEYTYNITQFDSHFTWVDLDWTAPTKGTAYTNSGGQIKISVSHLGDKDLNDYSIFSEPLPYIDISFLENQSNTLIQNLSLTDIS